MHIRKIELEGFHNHKKTTLELPEKGLVVVTGDNGSGKSSLVEAVSWAIWGKTLRGTQPGGEEKTPCRAALATDDFLVNRSRKNGKSSLKWRPSDAEKTDWSTTTEAKNALVSLTGDHSLWTKARVFSSHDAAHFTLATDKERKQLLEDVLGLDKFDPALQSCRVDLNALRAVQLKLERELDILSERHVGAIKRLGDAKLSLGDATEGDSYEKLEEKCSAFAKMLEEVTEEYTTARAVISGLERTLQERESDIQVNQSRLSVLSMDSCPMCFQKVESNHKESIEGEFLKTTETKMGNVVALEAKRVELLRDMVGLEEEYHDTRDSYSKLSAELAVEKRQVGKLRHLERAKESAEQTISDCEDEIESTQAELGQLLHEKSILENCERILGMKGIRAQTISRALSGLEAAANGWLSVLGGGLGVTLSDHTVTGAGKTVSTLSLGIANAGGGNGYKGASGGERRRVDVAMMLGLSAVADASLNRGGGTLFFDEVFDALDDDGVTGVVDVLNQLATDRAVVLVTHSDLLVSALKRTAALNVRLSDGELS